MEIWVNSNCVSGVGWMARIQEALVLGGPNEPKW